MNRAFLAAASAAALALALAACGSSNDNSGQSQAASTPPAATAASSAAASPSSSATSGPPGTTYTVTGNNGPNDSSTSYTITMTQADQHATLSQSDSLEKGDNHVAAAEFAIKGVSGQTGEDADSNAVAVGTDGGDYTAAVDQITQGTNFDNGVFSVGPGQSVTGWVAFELPAGVSVASVQWSRGNAQTATWTVSS